MTVITDILQTGSAKVEVETEFELTVDQNQGRSLTPPW